MNKEEHEVLVGIADKIFDQITNALDSDYIKSVNLDTGMEKFIELLMITVQKQRDNLLMTRIMSMLDSKREVKH